MRFYENWLAQTTSILWICDVWSIGTLYPLHYIVYPYLLKRLLGWVFNSRNWSYLHCCSLLLKEICAALI
jgi:hypothetical protein